MATDLLKFEAAARKYQSAVVRYCYGRLGGDGELALEVFDDVLEVLYKKWDRIDTDSDILPWLLRVADNLSKNALRRKRKYYSNVVPLPDGSDGGGGPAVTDEYFLPDEDETVGRIEKDLSDADRTLFHARFIEKKTLKEMESSMGFPYSTLRIRLKKIETTVRERIERGDYRG